MAHPHPALEAPPVGVAHDGLHVAVADRVLGLFRVPLVSTVYFSFTQYDGFNPPMCSGMTNWTYSLTPTRCSPSLGTRCGWSWYGHLRVVFGLGIGLLITKIKTGTGVFRTLFYLPYLAPPVAATIAFVFLLAPVPGRSTRSSGSRAADAGLVQRPTWSKPALTMLAIWGIGDLMVIFVASLLDRLRPSSTRRPNWTARPPGRSSAS